MQPITVHCPKCGSGLKLKDPSLLGRKARCSKCSHRFILEDPRGEVPLQLADSAPAQPPLMGTSARWVPDDPAPPTVVQTPGQSAGAVPPMPTAEADFQIPEADHIEVPEQFQFELDTGTAAPNTPDPRAAVPEAAAAAPTATDDAASGGASTTQNAPPVSSVRRTPRRKRRGSPLPMLIAAGTATAMVIGASFWMLKGGSTVEPENTAEAAPQVNEEWEAERTRSISDDESVRTLISASRTPIPTDYFPFTPHILLHLRPSEFYASDRTLSEFRALLGTPGVWLEEKVKEICRFEPAEIEEVTLIANFGARMTEPDVAAVVRLRQQQTASDLTLRRFKGTLQTQYEGRQLFSDGTDAYLLVDLKTFVVCPAALSDMLSLSLDSPAAATVEMLPLLKESDRNRLMTLMFDVRTLDVHREFIFIPQLQLFADRFLQWFSPDVQTVSWSMKLDEHLMMETLLRHPSDGSTSRALRQTEGRLNELPEQLADMVRIMQPSTSGTRRMIGRFPAMMQALRVGTTITQAPAVVRLTTFLPRHAAPNLAAGAMLTWNQSVVTDFSKAPAAVADAGLPKTIAERLRIKVEADFRRSPLYEVFDYLADETSTKIEIDGDAIKLAGMTQNMPQTFNLGEVEAIKVIDAMVSNPDYRGMLVIVVQENEGRVLVTSRTAAEAAGLPIYTTK